MTMIKLVDDELLGQAENGENVLIVEDDDDLRAYLTDIVRSLGYGVVSAGEWKTSARFA